MSASWSTTPARPEVVQSSVAARQSSWSSSASPAVPFVTSPTGQHPTGYSTADPQTSDLQSPASSTAARQLSDGAKAAVAVCSTLGAVALLVAALLLLYRRQRRRKPSYDRDHGPRQSASSSFFHSTGLFRSHIRLTSDVALSQSTTESAKSQLMTPAHPASQSYTLAVRPGSPDMRDGPQLSPPLRLRDRRLLPSICLGGGARHGRDSPSPPLTPLTTAQDERVFFPASPICSPATSKLVPRREHTPRLYYSHHRSNGSGSHGSASTNPGGYILPRAPPPVAFSFPRPESDAMAPRPAPGTGLGPSPLPPRTSQSSLAPSSAYSSLRHGSAELVLPVSAFSGRTAGTPPTSPTRPPRPHEEPLEIPDLVTPARGAGGVGIGLTTPNATVMPGPPPTKALPLLPSVVCPSQRAVGSAPGSPMPSSPPPEEDAKTAAPQYMQPAEAVAAASAAAHDPADMTPHHAPGVRASWNSWGGGGGSAPGVVQKAGQGRARAASPLLAGHGAADGGSGEHHDRPGSATVSVLHEEDLESLGGTY